MTKRKDPDVLALSKCIQALNKSTSKKMLRANLNFLNDHFIAHPAKSLPEHLKPRECSPDCTCDTDPHAPWCADSKK